MTFVPYHLGSTEVSPEIARTFTAATRPAVHEDGSREFLLRRGAIDTSVLPTERTTITEMPTCIRTTVAGRVRALRVNPWNGTPSLEMTLADETAAVTVIFTGRRSIPGVRVGTVMSVDGTAGIHHGRRVVLNPAYTLLVEPPAVHAPDHH